MNEFNQDRFNSFILDNGVIGFFDEPVTLKSGRKSHWYVNWRKVSNDVFLLDKLTDFVMSFTNDKGLLPDCFYGVPEGATKLGVLCQYKWVKDSPTYGPGSHVMPMGRGKPKEHGKVEDRYFIGVPNGRIVVLEDVTTTGGSLISTIDSICESGGNIVAAIGLTNRMQKREDGLSVKQALAEKGVNYMHMSDAFELLPPAYSCMSPGEHIAEYITQEFREAGLRNIQIR